MKFEVVYDENSGVVRTTQSDGMSPEGTREMFRQTEALLNQAPRRLILAVLGPGSLPDRETRDILTHESPAFDRMAFVGMSAPMRVLAKISIALLGRSNQTRFFTTEAEGLAWLTQD